MAGAWSVGCSLCPGSLPLGYHRLEVTGDALPHGSNVVATLIVAPQQAYLPDKLLRSPGIWGLNLQVYGLQGRESWGLGDFGDLSGFAATIAGLGVSALGLNPLHALFPGNPAHASPYSPSSRCFLNPLYINVEAAPDFAECSEASDQVRNADFLASLAALRNLRFIDYVAVASAKFLMFEKLYSSFRINHLEQGTLRAESSASFSARVAQRSKATRPSKPLPSTSGAASQGIFLGAIGQRNTEIPIRRRRRCSRAIMQIA